MEIALLNVVGPGRPRPHPVPGLFRRPDGRDLRSFGFAHDVIAAPWGSGVRPEELAARLDAERLRTSSSVDARRHRDRAPAPRSEEYAGRPRGRGILYIVDGVCATGGIEERMDDWGIDVVLTAAQKCFGVPPGPGHRRLFASGPMAKRRSLPSVPAYYSDILRWLPIMKDPAKYFSTPCVNEIRAFREGTRIMLEEGMDARFERHAKIGPGDPGRASGRWASGFSPSPSSWPTRSPSSVYPAGVDDKAFRTGYARNGVVVAGGLARDRGQGLPHGPHGQPDRGRDPVRLRGDGEDADRARLSDSRPGRASRRAETALAPCGPESDRLIARRTKAGERCRARSSSIPARPRTIRDLLSRKARDAYLGSDLNDELDKEDFVALKIHFGEKHNTGYIRPPWLRGLIGEVRKKTPRAFLTDSNTLYVGHRSNSVDHIRLAWSHGFTPGRRRRPGHHRRRPDRPRSARSRRRAPAGWPRPRSPARSSNSDALICLSHVTGHVQTGIGAALKNIGMGCASRAGKLDQHSVAHPRVTAKACRNCGLCSGLLPRRRPSSRPKGTSSSTTRAASAAANAWSSANTGRSSSAGTRISRRDPGEGGRVCPPRPPPFQGEGGLPQLPGQDHQGLRLHGQGRAPDRRGHRDPRLARSRGHRHRPRPTWSSPGAGGRDVWRAGYDIDWSAQLRHGEAIGLGSTRLRARRAPGMTDAFAGPAPAPPGPARPAARLARVSFSPPIPTISNPRPSALRLFPRARAPPRLCSSSARAPTASRIRSAIRRRPEAKAAVREEEQRAGCRFFGLARGPASRSSGCGWTWPGRIHRRRRGEFRGSGASRPRPSAPTSSSCRTETIRTADHRLAFRWWRRLAASDPGARWPRSSSAIRRPSPMRDDVIFPFDEATAAVEGELLRFHRSQHRAQPEYAGARLRRADPAGEPGERREAGDRGALRRGVRDRLYFSFLSSGAARASEGREGQDDEGVDQDRGRLADLARHRPDEQRADRHDPKKTRE